MASGRMLAAPALPLKPGLEIVISRPGMSQGLSQTRGIQLFPRAFVTIGAVRIGAQWRNLDSATANGVAAAFAGVSRRVGKAQLDAVARYRIKTGVRGGASPSAWEFSVTARRSFGKLGLRFNADYSPDEFGRGPSLWIEGGPTLALGRRTQVSAMIGRRWRSGDPNYAAFNAGISRVLAPPVALDVRYFGTNRSSLGERYESRVTMSLRLAL